MLRDGRRYEVEWEEGCTVAQLGLAIFGLCPCVLFGENEEADADDGDAGREELTQRQARSLCLGATDRQQKTPRQTIFASALTAARSA
jgi:hypothetical protein